jgi:aryl-alcohol dehydrogenase-like predicted oxidoreductase
LASCAHQAGIPLIALSLAWTLQRLTSLVIGPRTVDQLEGQLASLQVDPEADLLDEIDRIVPPGGVVVPYYLDGSLADFRPHPYHR